MGLKNCHSYTVLDVKEIVLENGELEYLAFVMNPTGNFFMKDDEVWKGDWGPMSDKWTEKTRKQLSYYVTPQDMARAKKRQKVEV